jgi:hypothetical protein
MNRAFAIASLTACIACSGRWRFDTRSHWKSAAEDAGWTEEGDGHVRREG